MNTILCKYTTNIYHLILSTVQSSFLLCSISDSLTCITNYNWCMFTMKMDLWGKQFKAIYELTGKIKLKTNINCCQLKSRLFPNDELCINHWLRHQNWLECAAQRHGLAVVLKVSGTTTTHTHTDTRVLFSDVTHRSRHSKHLALDGMGALTGVYLAQLNNFPRKKHLIG